LAAAIGSVLVGCEHSFLVITGDVASSGKFKEYEIAIETISSIVSSVAKGYNQDLKVVCVPGNHDCDFSQDKSTRRALLKSNLLSEVDDDLIETMTSVQSDYRDFADVIETKPDAVHQHGVLTIARFKSATSITFLKINSAWVSQESEQQGSLVLPLDIPSARSGLDVEDCVLTMLHHTLNWFEADNARTVRRQLDSCSDIVLTGHEHDAATYSRTYPKSGGTVHYLEGGVLQEGPRSSQSTFNTLVIDTEASAYNVQHFTWYDDIYVPDESEQWHPFVRNRHRVAAQFELSATFLDFLTDPGANFSHPRKAELKLTHLFVYPDLKRIPLEGGRDTGLVRNPLDFVITQRLSHLFGPEKSGKTALARQLVLDLHAQGYVPVFVNGRAFKPRTGVATVRELRKLITKQYSKAALEPLWQVAPEARVLVIDDHHKVRLTRQGKAELLKTLAHYFDRIVLLSGEDVRWEYLARSPDAAKNHPVFEYAHAEIMPLGYLKRSDLIRRWYSIGRNPDQVLEDTQGAFDREVVQAEHLITGLVGRNLVPSFPIFVLILLQQLEARRRIDTSVGSQGYLYQSLITNALAKIANKPSEIDGRYNYLTEFASLLLADDVDGLPVDDVRDWQQEYCRRFFVDLEFSTTVAQLTDVGVLHGNQDEVGFRYPYIKYFFIARWLKNNLREREVQQRLHDMARKLFHEPTANVMLFLAHLSDDALVLNTMLQAARELFEKRQLWLADAQTKYLNDLMLETPRLVIDVTVPPEERRREELAAQDEDESPPWEELPDELDEALEPLLQLNSAFKTTQILGLILKNYSGSLPGPRKVELAEACYRLSLRVLSFLFKVIENHGPEFVEAVVQHVAKLHPEAAKDRLTLEANALLFGFAERASFGIVKHLSQSVGVQGLGPVYRAVLQALDESPEARILDLSIRIDHFPELPASDAIALYEDQLNNHLVCLLVKHLVWYHMYMFRVDYQLRQRLCEKLEIPARTGLIDSDTKLITVK
jgi:predicted phosphodiesterase